MATKKNLNNKLRMENEQMSTPLPAMAVKMPPMKPVSTSTTACQAQKLTIKGQCYQTFLPTLLQNNLERLILKNYLAFL
jgi:hypothetical protein